MNELREIGMNELHALLVILGIAFTLLFLMMVLLTYFDNQIDNERLKIKNKFEGWWVENFEKNKNYNPTEKILMAKQKQEAWKLYLSGELKI